MTTEITLPRAMTGNNLENMLAGLQVIRECQDAIVVDCSELTFIDPCGLTLLASALEAPAKLDRSIRFDFLGTRICSYLQRMNFFNQFAGIEGVDLRQQARNNQIGYLCELTRIAVETEAENAVETLAWAATGTIQSQNASNSDDDEYAISLFHPIKYALSELVENAVTHAKREGYQDACVWVAAQYYKATGSVKIAVTDNGCGFLGSLRHHPSLAGDPTHTAAISAALQPRVSCNRNLVPLGLSENQGVGLTTTARIARRAKGGITIFSGNGLHNDTTASRQLKRSQRLRTIAPHWQGVGVVIDIDRASLSGIKVHELLPDDEPRDAGQNAPDINFV